MKIFGARLVAVVSYGLAIIGMAPVSRTIKNHLFNCITGPFFKEIKRNRPIKKTGLLPKCMNSLQQPG